MNKNTLWILFVSTVVFFYAPSLSAEPKVSVRTEYYPVEGSSFEELSESMKQNAPAQAGGHFGATKWNVIWSYEAAPNPEGCSLTRAAVELQVVFYMPRLMDTQNTNQKILKKWNRFIQKLQHHEDGHRKIGLEAAREIEEIFKALDIRSNCSEIDSAVNQTAQAVISQKRMEDVRYDARTRYGLRQGASLRYTETQPEKSGETLTFTPL